MDLQADPAVESHGFHKPQRDVRGERVRGREYPRVLLDDGRGRRLAHRVQVASGSVAGALERAWLRVDRGRDEGGLRPDHGQRRDRTHHESGHDQQQGQGDCSRCRMDAGHRGLGQEDASECGHPEDEAQLDDGGENPARVVGVTSRVIRWSLGPSSTQTVNPLT
jgi:hypothetical protein